MSWIRALGAVVLGGISGCAPEADEPVAPEPELAETATKTDELYPSSSSVWPSTDISVCWRTPGFATEKAWVRSAVYAWTANSAVRFTGWGSCGLWPFYGSQIPILIDDSNPLVSFGLGKNLAGMTLNFSFVNWSPACQSTPEDPGRAERCIRKHALHEFGHALGFAHEQNRTDTPASCVDPVQGSMGDVFFGAWDSFSIMNYCNDTLGLVEPTGRLSATDRAGVEKYYGWPNYFADVGGDGRADAIVVATDGIWVKHSTGTEFFGQSNWTQNQPYYGEFKTDFKDVTGDGRADAIVVNANGTTVRRSTGTLFENQHSFSPQVMWGAHGTYFGDVTGDHRADAVVVNETTVNVFAAASDGSGNFGPGFTFTVGSLLSQTHTIHLANVDGDVAGRADLILVAEGGVRVFRSTGSGFQPGTNWTGFSYWGTRGNFFEDVTGDGKADAIVVLDDQLVVRRSNGSSFLANETWSLVPFFGDRGIAFAHVSNSVGADAIAISNAGIDVRPTTGSAFEPGNQLWTEAFYSITRRR